MPNRMRVERRFQPWLDELEDDIEAGMEDVGRQVVADVTAGATTYRIREILARTTFGAFRQGSRLRLVFYNRDFRFLWFDTTGTYKGARPRKRQQRRGVEPGHFLKEAFGRLNLIEAVKRRR